MPRSSFQRPDLESGVSEDRRARLVDLRDRLTAAIDESGTRDLAPLSRALVAVLAQLDELAPASAPSPANEIAARRAARRAALNGPA